MERDVRLLSILTGGVSRKYEAVQEIANQFSIEEAKHCYALALTQLCIYLDDPFDPSYSSVNKTAYIEAVVASYERLRETDPWFSMNKGSFRMALTTAVLVDMRGQGSSAIRRKLGEFDFHGDDQEWTNEDEERLGWQVIEMHEVGP